MSIEFDWPACICEHAESAHDDGFGCTDPDCPCIAGWVWDSADDELGEAG